jgi:hypothetical protein
MLFSSHRVGGSAQLEERRVRVEVEEVFHRQAVNRES